MYTAPINKSNPLSKFMRQPKIYISLPSQGRYWAVGAVEIPENGQLSVFSMTAADELMFKTPDALMNGQAVVDVIQSCIPNIKNAWAIPSIDLDMLLVAIRIATYGDKMEVSYTVPVINESVDYQVNLHNFVDQFANIQWIEQVPISDELIVFIKPLTYKHMSIISQKSFETNKMIQLADGDSMSDSQKSDMIKASFKTLSDLTTDMVVSSIIKIKHSEGDVEESRFIREFITNADKSVVDTIQKHINDLKTQNEIKPLTLQTTEDQRQAGAPDSFEVPINFDQSNFFA